MLFEDKTIITVFCCLVLGIFLDHQAKRQHQIIEKNIKKISLEELIEDNKKKLNRKLEEIPYEKVQDLYEDLKNKKIKKNVETLDQLKGQLELENLDKGKNLYLKNIHNLILPFDESETTELFLYFPKLTKNKTTEMYQVKRKVKGKITPLVALSILQKGPLSNEQGLVNAYFEGINLIKISYNDDKQRLNLYFDDGFYSKNPIIMQDRVHQICLTLSQFENIKEVFIWINDQPYKKLNRCDRNYKQWNNN